MLLRTTHTLIYSYLSFLPTSLKPPRILSLVYTYNRKVCVFMIIIKNKRKKKLKKKKEKKTHVTPSELILKITITLSILLLTYILLL